MRRIQDNRNGLKTAFLLRSMTVQSKRSNKWNGNYYFYHDQDCIRPTYGIQLQGMFASKKGNVTFAMTSLRIAAYNSRMEKEILTKYNTSCPGNLSRAQSAKHVVYVLTRSDMRSDRCLHALGIGKREFTGGAMFQTNTPPGGAQSDELLQTDVDLTRDRNITTYRQQWPLVGLSTPKCLTCSRVGLAVLTSPPKLYTRNSTRLDGVWASVRCHRFKPAFWTTRMDKYEGNKFDSYYYHMDHTSERSIYKCHTPLLELRARGTLREVGNSVEVPGGIVYELYVQKAYLTPRVKTYEQAFNAAPRGTCGLRTWEVGKTQDIMATGGCAILQLFFKKGSGSKILVRTVRDEKRKEMYFGSGMGDTKTGPLFYEHVMQSCNTYPVKMTTTKGPTYSTTDAPTQTSSTPEEDPTGIESVHVEVHGIKQRPEPTSKAVSLNGVTRTVLVCLFLYLKAI